MNSQGELAFCGGRSLTPHNANGAVMFETSRASEAEFAARSEQAAKVAEALAGAGFTVRRFPEGDRRTPMTADATTVLFPVVRTPEHRALKPRCGITRRHRGSKVGVPSRARGNSAERSLLAVYRGWPESFSFASGRVSMRVPVSAR